MFYFSEADVQELLPVSEAIRLMRMAFLALAQGRAVNQPRRRLILESGSVLHSMAGSVGNYFGTKFYATNPRYGAHFYFYLFSGKTATPLAVMEANYLGQIRTGAASGYAVDLLANPEAKTMGLIGSGFQAQTQLAAIRSVRPIETVRVWSRSEEKRRKFAEEQSVIAASSAEEAVRGSDIVVTATNAKDPVMESDWVADGTLVNAMGSNVANRRELPGDLVKRAGLVVVDSLEQARIEAGDLILADSWDNVAELKDVQQHYDPSGVTIFKSIGLGIEDVAAAAFIYERALATPERFADRNRATH